MTIPIYGNNYVTTVTWDLNKKSKYKCVNYSTLDTITIVGCKYYIDDINNRLVFVNNTKIYININEQEIKCMKQLLNEFSKDYNFSFDLKNIKHNTFIPISFFEKLDNIGEHLQFHSSKKFKTGIHNFHI